MAFEQEQETSSTKDRSGWGSSLAGSRLQEERREKIKSTTTERWNRWRGREESVQEETQ